MLKLAAISLSLTLVGCSLAISTPFKQVEQDGDQQSYLVVLTEAVVRDDRMQRQSFDDYVDRIADGLEQRPGLYGYSLRRELFGNRAWTMTVWHDEASLAGFKASQPHVFAMRDSGQILQEASFARAWVEPEQLPMSWEQALELLRENGRSYRF